MRTRTIGGHYYNFLSSLSRRGTILISTPTSYQLESILGALKTCLIVLRNCYEDCSVLTGEGSFDLFCAEQLRKSASIEENEELSLVTKAVSNSIRKVQFQVAVNSGIYKSFQTCKSVFFKQNKSNENKMLGFSLEKPGMVDTTESKSLDCFRSKYRAFQTAFEISSFIVAIDHFSSSNPIVISQPSTPKPQNPNLNAPQVAFGSERLVSEEERRRKMEKKKRFYEPNNLKRREKIEKAFGVDSKEITKSTNQENSFI